MKVTDSISVLKGLGYTFVYRVNPPVKPETVDKRFKDVVPEFSSHPKLRGFGEYKLYKHQYVAYRALLEGRNVILRSGTGSGKTEAWVLYFLNRAKRGVFRGLVVYPTLALANDQIRRIELYSNAVSIPVLQLDAPSRDRLRKRVGKAGIRDLVAGSRLVITNPAYLLMELKRYFTKPRDSLLEPFLSNLDMIVVDELDFYGPRSLALLMGMIELLSLVNPGLQVVLLTATLANPGEVGEYLRRVTGRDYVVVDGEAFHVENHTIVVLGKDLEGVWRSIRGLTGELTGREDIDPDIIKALQDYVFFRENAYRVVSYLEALGYSVPSIGMDYVEILGSYFGDDGVTLVFTKSIAKAEEVVKRVRTRYPDKSGLVASHHHLVPKDVREEIEERARRGEVKILVSPRTLTQGIDIGSIVRVVHLGLPEDVREYLQREGRKGRRENIPFTESIIIPSTKWDWELLSKGLGALDKWLSLPLEKTIINPGNLYIRLFTGLVKLVSPWLRAELSDLEKEALEKAGVLGRDGVRRKKLKWIWDRMGFYEFAPPYGIKRYLVEGDKLRPLEPIGHCDLVEKFQIGCIDYSSDAMVTGHRVIAKGRVVTSVYEKPLREINFWEDEALAEAYEEYIDVKRRWGEQPSLLRDLVRGKIFTEVYCVVYPPRRGFGRYIKVPNRVLWLVSSEKPRVFRVGDKHIVAHDKKAIYVPTPVHGEYNDYTYGYLYEVDETLDPGLLRLGLAFITILLRRLYGIAFETIVYGVESVGDKKFFELHEPESAALIDSLDWLDLRMRIDPYTPDELDLILLSQIDDLAYSYFLSNNLDWKPVKEYAKVILDYILARERIVLEVAGKLRSIPRPSPGLKVVVVDGFAETIDRGDVFSLPMKLTAVAYYDGGKPSSYVALQPYVPGVKPGDELRGFESEVEDLVYYSGFKLVVRSKSIAGVFKGIGLRKLPKLIEEEAVELRPLLAREGLDKLSISDFESLLYRVFEGYRPVYIDEIHRIVSRIREKGYTRLLEGEEEVIRRFIEARALSNYILYLLVRSEKT